MLKPMASSAPTLRRASSELSTAWASAGRWVSAISSSRKMLQARCQPGEVCAAPTLQDLGVAGGKHGAPRVYGAEAFAVPIDERHKYGVGAARICNGLQAILDGGVGVIQREVLKIDGDLGADQVNA